MLASVGVPAARERALQYPHQWSGGMRQRAVITMALVNEPDLIIADEPTTALDATVQAQVLEVLQRIQRDSGVAIAIITHDLGVIAQVASRVAVMYAGSVVEMASTEELFWDSRHPYTRALMDSRPAQSSRGEPLTTIPGRPPAMAAVPEGCPFCGPVHLRTEERPLPERTPGAESQRRREKVAAPATSAMTPRRRLRYERTAERRGESRSGGPPGR